MGVLSSEEEKKNTPHDPPNPPILCGSKGIFYLNCNIVCIFNEKKNISFINIYDALVQLCYFRIKVSQNNDKIQHETIKQLIN